MKFRVEVLQQFAVTNLTTGEQIPMRSYAGLISKLAFSEVPVSRVELATSVWSDATSDAARNRLRVALSKLRHLLPEGISESEIGLSLNPNVIYCDAAHLRTAIEESQNTVTRQGEMAALHEALLLTQLRVTTESKVPGESKFAQFICQEWLRLCELAQDCKEPELAAEAAREATHCNPDSLQAWLKFLGANWTSSNAIGALEDAALRAPERVQKDPKFKELRKELSTKRPPQATGLSGPERQFWIDLIESVRLSRPDIMRILLSSPQTLSLSGKQPRLMHDALEASISASDEERDHTWERSAARMIGLKAWLGDAHGVLESSRWLLKSTKDVQILRATWNSVAIAHSLLRQWEEAYEALDQTMEFAKEMDSEIYVRSTRGNWCYFKMQQAEFDLAGKSYDEEIAQLESVGTQQAQFEKAVAIGNRALIPVFQSDWEKAEAELMNAIEVRSKRGLTVQMGMLLACLALARANLGKLETIVSLMRQGLLDAFESDSFRTEQFTFEVAAATLFALGDTEFAGHLATWTLSWRERSSAPRSAAENLLVTRIKRPISSLIISEDTRIAGKETMKRLRTAVARSLSS